MRKSIRSRFALGLLGLALVVAAGFVAAAVSSSGSASGKGGIGLAAKSGDPDANSKNLAGIPNEGPDASYAAQQEAERAYPADSVPDVATDNSIAAFSALKSKGNGKGAWDSIGPSQAKYPALLDQFLAGGKEYTASGRVTALAIGGCKNGKKCSLYLGAAGGGVWVADKATGNEGQVHWQFKSGSFGTNAIGALLVDPSDPSGDTVYAGTGEPNASADSEAGLGIYKSTDGGDSWSFVPGSEVFRDRAIGALAFDKDHNLLVGLASAIRGVASISNGGAIGCNTPTTPPGCSVRGLYRQTGATFTRIFTSALPNGVATRGVTDVELDPWNPSTIYLASFQQGVWRSLDNGATWTQIKSALNAAQNTDRAQFALGKLTGGKTRMYVGIGNAGTDVAQFYRTDDAAGAATFTNMTTSQNSGYCTGQCWYDNVVYSPSEDPNVVYIGGSFSYGQQNVVNNGRAVLMSTDGGVTWSDMTRDQGDNGWIHPDQHALVTVPGNPLQWIVGDDGGVIRSNGQYVDGSGKCASYGATGANLAFCQSLLSRIPDQSVALNKGLSTLQFQSLSVDPKHPQNGLMGGTQDNGTFEFTGSNAVWPQIIYGDGGQSGWNAADSNLRFNTFTGQASDVNFRNGDPAYWVIGTGPIVASNDGSYFYPPIIADPNPAAAGTIFQGSNHVWRTQDWGGNQAYLEANCPEFTTSAAATNCGDFAILGGTVSGVNTPGDLTGTAYGADRQGTFVAAIERAPSNTGTLWAATGTGRLFISDNADAAAPSVAFTRLDSSPANDPSRFISSIYVDPANPNHAWVSYSGYNINTPAQPGHVFEVTRSGASATFTDLTYNLADLPVTDLVRDDLTGDLYASTDFGVMKLASGTTTWTVAAAGMPMVEVPGLTIVPGARVLYAATHGLGAWRLNLGKP